MSQDMNILYIALLMSVGELAATKLQYRIHPETVNAFGSEAVTTTPNWTDYVKICKRDQNTINDCVRNSIKSMRSHLPKGIPEINVPSMDPFTFGEIKPVKGGLGDLQIVLKNMQVAGLSDFEIKKLNVDVVSMVITTTLKIPVIRVNGQYVIDLQLLALPIKGEGPFAGNMTDINANAMLKYNIETRDGKEYVKFTSCDLTLKLGDYHIAMEGLLGDTLGEASQRIISENKEELLRNVLPYVESTISNAIVLDVANSIASAATYDELLPAP